MGTETGISWCDSTFNPWEGCQKVGPGCDHCYAEARNARFGGGMAVNWGPHAPRRRTSAANWRNPIKWERQHSEFFAQHGRRQRVFCASLADVFDSAVDTRWRVDLFDLITKTPNLDWLLLTKRIGNAASMFDEVARHLWLLDQNGAAQWPPNVWLGATVVNQAEAERDVPKLLRVPARLRFLSMEPLLGPVDLAPMFEHGADAHGDTGVHWVIVGGESGPNARPMHPAWARHLRDQCAGATVPLLFKQWGEWAPRGPESMGYPLVENVPRVCLTDCAQNGQDLAGLGSNACWMQRAGKHVSGSLLDGLRHEAWPVVP